MRSFNRRGFLKGASVGLGALAGARLLGGRLVGRAEAQAAGDLPAVLLVYLQGGYNAIFASANSFVGNGAFGVTSGNIKRIGDSDVFVDNGTFGMMGNTALNHMAAIGVRHGLSSHPAAQRAMWHDGNRSYPIALSKALGGEAAIRCVAMGKMPPGGSHTALGDVSLQQVRDLSTTIAALGGITSGVAPDRALAASGLEAAQRMSMRSLAANPTASRSLAEGYPASVAMLRQAQQDFDYAEMASAYGLTPNAEGRYPTVAGTFQTQVLGAELMIRAGANVVAVTNGGWDTHGDVTGTRVRTMMKDRKIPGTLKTFVERTMAMEGRNVVTVIMGDFSRSIPGSNHQANLTATVIGKHVKLGTTGKVNSDVALPTGTPGIKGLWAYIAAALQSPEAPFGANPHPLLRA
jgi:hypothetical protein